MNINDLVEKGVREELGAARVERIKLTAVASAQGSEIKRLLVVVEDLKR